MAVEKRKGVSAKRSPIVSGGKRKKIARIKSSESQTLELAVFGESRLPVEAANTEMEAPSSFLRESAYRDAKEAEERYDRLLRTTSNMIDTQKFLIKLSNLGIKYADVVSYLELNADFEACGTEDEPTKVYSALNRMANGNERGMYKGLRQYGAKMDRKRKAAEASKTIDLPARNRKILTYLRKVVGMKESHKMFDTTVNELAWINKNREDFERMVELKMSKSKEAEVAEALQIKDLKVGRVIGAARRIGWIKGNGSKISLEQSYFKMFHPEGTIANMNAGIRVFYRH